MEIVATLLAFVALPGASMASVAQSTPGEGLEPSDASRSVQLQIDENVADRAAEQREKIVTDAVTALAETEKALAHLEEGDTEEALASLAVATGRLELILARDPDLALAPVDTDVVVHDLHSGPEVVKTAIGEARQLLAAGRIQEARPLVANLASEVVFETRNLPLASYPAAIKEAARRIDAGSVEEARVVLETALNTLVITESVTPLSPMRAWFLLKDARALARVANRSREQNEELAALLDEARNQLRLAEILGYGSEDSYEPIYLQIEALEQRVSGGKSGTGWFEEILDEVSELF